MSKTQIGLLVGLLVAAIALPSIVMMNGTSWVSSHSPWIQFAKFIELGLIAGLGVMMVVNGVGLIKASAAAHIESLGCNLLGGGALILGSLFVFVALNTNTYSSVRGLVVHSEAPDIKVNPKMTYVEADGTIFYKIPGTFQSVVINLDFIDDDPKPRESDVVINPEMADSTDTGREGWYKYTVDEDLRERVERVGVFYVADGVPSGEKVWEKPAI